MENTLDKIFEIGRAYKKAKFNIIVPHDGLKWNHEVMKFNGRNDFFHFYPK